MSTSSDNSRAVAHRGWPQLQGRAALLVLTAVALMNYLDRALLSILQEPIKGELALSDVQLGALTGSTFAIFYATAALPLGMLVDRCRRTWILATAVTVWTSITALNSLAAGSITVAILRTGVALGEAVATPATQRGRASPPLARQPRISKFGARDVVG